MGDRSIVRAGVRYRRVAGVALIGLLAIHPWLRPEGAWALLAACDVAALATAVGLVVGADRVVATAFLFQLAVGVPALVTGLMTTYRWNWSGIAIHVAPIVLGAPIVLARELPPRAALHAWLGYAVTLVVASVVVPTGVDVNFSHRVWAPVADTLDLWTFRIAVLAVVGALLVAGHVGMMVLRRRAV